MTYMNLVARVTSISVALFAVWIWLVPIDTAMAIPQRTPEQDRQALIALENTWLKGEHDPTVLKSILGSDFIHPVATGDFATKAQHIRYSSKHLPAANLKKRFENLSVRIYGDVGIVNGIVVISDKRRKDANRTIFTDVFVHRDGRWQAINAQENKVKNEGRSAP
jgi:Domain of unknown function (DUF4440)